MAFCYNENMHKIIAYFLIFVGLVLMFFAFTGMYQTFVNKKPVVQVVQMKPFAVNTQFGAMQLDSSLVNQIFNLTLFALFMFFLLGTGRALAAVGNGLLKTERICETLQRLRTEEALQHEKEIRKL